MAYESWGAWCRSSVARAASVVARVFIWERTSSNCAGGRVLRVREIASGQLRPAGRSTPRGRGGIEDVRGGASWMGAGGKPLDGIGIGIGIGMGGGGC